MLQNWEEWLIHQKAMLPLRKTSTGWTMLMEFSKCRVLNLGKDNPRDRLGAELLENSPVEKFPVVLVGTLLAYRPCGQEVQ